jgi:hypothetical protein
MDTSPESFMDLAQEFQAAVSKFCQLAEAQKRTEARPDKVDHLLELVLKLLDLSGIRGLSTTPADRSPAAPMTIDPKISRSQGTSAPLLLVPKQLRLLLLLLRLQLMLNGVLSPNVTDLEPHSLRKSV